MDHKGNNRRVTGADLLEVGPHEERAETAFHDSSNPVLAPAKAVDTKKKKSWKRKIITWSFLALLLVISGFVLYALLKINHVDVRVLANNRRTNSGTKPESVTNKTENGLSAEAINIAREAMGSDPASGKPLPSPTASPGASSDTAYRLDYSATMNPGIGPATDFGTTSPSSNQSDGIHQPDSKTERR